MYLHLGNDFLVKNPDYDFFIDVSSRKTLSFRANGKIDVSLMAKNLVGGGGHKNASGMSTNGKIENLIPLIVKEFAKII